MYFQDNFEKIHTILLQGGLILYPTDTIWGIGCDATQEEAVQKVYTLKQRPAHKGLIVLADSIAMLKEYVPHIHPKIETLLSLHTQPLTVVYPSGRGLARSVFAPDGSIAIRVTHDEFCKKVIGLLGKPIVSTSANISEAPFPTHFGTVSSDILEGVNYVAKYKQDKKLEGQPSVIARLNEQTEELDFLRT